MRAEEPLGWRAARLEERIRSGEDRLGKHLGTDDQLLLERLQTDARIAVELAAERATGITVRLTNRDRDARGVGERAEIARRHHLRSDAGRAVARELRFRARRQPDADARRERERVAVFAEDARVGREPNIADRRFVRRLEADAVHHRRLAVLIEGDRQVHREAEAIGERDAAADVGEELMPHDIGALVAFRVVGDERLVAVVECCAEGRAEVAAEIERVGAEELAAALGRLEAVEGKTVVFCAAAGDATSVSKPTVTTWLRVFMA